MTQGSNLSLMSSAFAGRFFTAYAITTNRKCTHFKHTCFDECIKSKPEAFFLHCHLMKMPFQVVGAENPVLMSAAEQIFGAGGKRMRPALVFLVSRATAELVGLK